MSTAARPGLSLCLICKDEGNQILEWLQHHQDFLDPQKDQFVLIDNASSDATAELIKNWKKSFSDQFVTSLRRELNHLAEARNEALRQASRPWVYFIDADCRVTPTGWKNLCEKLMLYDHQTDVVALAGGATFEPKTNAVPFFLHQMQFIRLAHFDSIQIKPPMHEKLILLASSMNLALKREEVLRLGGFHPSFDFFGEDLSLSHRLANDGKKIIACPQIEVIHLQKMHLFLWFQKMLKYGRAQTRTALFFPRHLRIRGVIFLATFLILISGLFLPLIAFLLGGAYFTVLLTLCTQKAFRQKSEILITSTQDQASINNSKLSAIFSRLFMVFNLAAFIFFTQVFYALGIIVEFFVLPLKMLNFFKSQSVRD